MESEKQRQKLYNGKRNMLAKPKQAPPNLKCTIFWRNAKDKSSVLVGLLSNEIQLELSINWQHFNKM